MGILIYFFFFQAEDGIRDIGVTGVQTCALPIFEQCLVQLRTYPFEMALSFNSMVLQRYEKGSIGITPHRDRLSYINLVCVRSEERRVGKECRSRWSPYH